MINHSPALRQVFFSHAFWLRCRSGSGTHQCLLNHHPLLAQQAQQNAGQANRYQALGKRHPVAHVRQLAIPFRSYRQKTV
jgi:hypothetical protein